jgi:cytochrome b
VRGPRAVLAYLRSLLGGRPQHFTGHNPAGAVAIVLMLAVVVVHVGGVLVASLLHRENLLKAMINGCKRGD